VGRALDRDVLSSRKAVSGRERIIVAMNVFLVAWLGAEDVARRDDG
jgi:hypothetical protein